MITERQTHWKNLLVADGDRLSWPAPERNKEPILAVLKDVLPETGTVLELAAGSGQHTAYFAGHFPNLTWQASEPEEEYRRSIQAWIQRDELTNAPPPLELDTRADAWPIDRFDAVLCCNMIHISPWESCTGLMAGVGRGLSPGGALIFYGPFSIGGEHSAESNREFDESLKSRDPSWGVRDMADVTALAADHGLAFDHKVEMPSNNLCVIYRKENP
jgi:hypothetical protein